MYACVCVSVCVRLIMCNEGTLFKEKKTHFSKSLHSPLKDTDLNVAVPP